jgi:hypothetical protein
MPATKSLGEFEVLGFRRRGFSSTITPFQAAMAKYGRQAVIIGESPVSGQIYSGYTPDIYAAASAIGTGSGNSEANAMPLLTALSTVSSAGTGTVGVVTGTPSAPASGGARWTPIFRVTGSGTVGSPIRVVAKYPTTDYPDNTELWTELRSSTPFAVGSNSNVAVCGVTPGVSNVQWIGFYLNQTYAPPRPSNGTVVASYNTTNVLIEKFTMDQTVNPDNDNFDSFYLEDSENTIIRNCLIRGGAGDSSVNHNASSITTYGCINFLFEHIEFAGVNGAFFIKGSNPNNSAQFNSGIIRYNKCSGANQAFIELANQTDGVSVYQNLGYRNRLGIWFDASGSGTIANSYVRNNTMVDNSEANYGSDTTNFGASLDFQKNISAFTAASSAFHVNFGADDVADFSPFDDNLYHEVGGSGDFRKSSTSYSGLSAWAAAIGKEASSAETSPGFTDSASDNYHRTSYADGRGCYITGTEEIGVEAA